MVLLKAEMGSFKRNSVNNYKISRKNIQQKSVILRYTIKRKFAISVDR